MKKFLLPILLLSTFYVNAQTVVLDNMTETPDFSAVSSYPQQVYSAIDFSVPAEGMIISEVQGLFESGLSGLFEVIIYNGNGCLTGCPGDVLYSESIEVVETDYPFHDAFSIYVMTLPNSISLVEHDNYFLSLVSHIHTIPQWGGIVVPNLSQGNSTVLDPGGFYDVGSDLWRSTGSVPGYFEGRFINYAFRFIDNTSTGIKEITNAINVFPNPVNEILNINYNGQNALVSYTITSISGAVIAQDNLVANKIDVSLLATGVYILELTDATGAKGIQKFVRN